jgi:nitrate ABC transporter permease subunit
MANPALSAPSPVAIQFKKLSPLIFPPIICTSAVLIIWQFLFRDPASKMPAPLKVVSESTKVFLNFFTDGGVGSQLFTSLQRVALGYGLAAIAGVVMGLAIGVSPFLRRGFDPMIQVLRTIPPLAWLPIALAIFQDGKPAAIFIIFITAVWPILLNTAVGVQQVPTDYNNVSKVLRLSGPEYLFNILIPSTVPYIFTGLRIGIGLAWLAIVAAEMLSTGAGGIGTFIWENYNSGGDDNMSQIIFAVLCVGLVGLCLDRLVSYLGSLIASE